MSDEDAVPEGTWEERASRLLAGRGERPPYEFRRDLWRFVYEKCVGGNLGVPFGLGVVTADMPHGLEVEFLQQKWGAASRVGDPSQGTYRPPSSSARMIAGRPVQA